MDLEAEVQRDINSVIEELRKTKSLSKAYEFLIWLKDIESITLCNNLNIVYPIDYEEIKLRFDTSRYSNQIEQLCMNTKLSMIDYDRKMCKIAQYFEKKYQIGNEIVYDKRVSIDDVDMLSGEFLKYYDKEIFNLYEKLNYEGRIFIANLDKASGITMCGNKVVKPYVLLNVKICEVQFIDQIFVLVHEIIHAYITSKHDKLKKDEAFRLHVNNLEEVYSLFSELALANYLENIGFNKHDVTAYKKGRVVNLVETLKCFKKSKYLNIVEDAYAYGNVLSYHFYDQYLNNMNMAKDNITNFMIDSAYYDKKYMLNNYGLDNKKILSPDLIEKHTKKYLKRIPK